MRTLTIENRAILLIRSKYSIVLLLIFGISLALRISLPYENIFTGGHVIFQGNDPWYHMRLVENLLQHFPHLIAFDPFTLYPYGQEVPFAPFFDMLLASVIWIIGLGSPTQNVMDTVGAYFPAIVGALVTIPVYFIGRELFNRNAGLLAAGLIAVLPGHFFFRSTLGYSDHHSAEVLFSTTAVLFLILAIKRAKEKETSFQHIRSRDWGNLKKPLIYALLAGLVLGIYLITWNGALLFVFLIFTYIILQYVIDHLRSKSSDYLCIIGVPMFFIALIVVIPFLNFPSIGTLVIASLVITVLAIPILSGVSLLMDYRNVKQFYYPLALVGLAVVGIALLYIIDPSLYHAAMSKFRQVFLPSETAQTIGEVQSLFSLSGPIMMVTFFTTSIFFALTALGMLIYTGIKERRSERTILFFVIWCLIMLAAMMGQNRFAYYFAVNVSLLAGYLYWKILEWGWVYSRETLPERAEGKTELAKGKSEGPRRSIQSYLDAGYARVVVVAVRTIINIMVWGNKAGTKTSMRDRKANRMRKKAKVQQVKEPRRPVKSYLSAWHGLAGMALIVFLVGFIPNISLTITMAREVAVPNEAWYSSLTWMREKTPDPFGDPDFYYESYERPSSGEGFDYPQSAYGIMNYWDYGHWITRIARRIPSANPFQAGVWSTARFFVAQDESSANEIIEKLGSKYTIVDYEMSTGKFGAIVDWAGESKSQYFDVYYQDTIEGGSGSIEFYYPEYYLSMSSRLYNFGGQAVVPHNSTFVISYEEKSQTLGSDTKEITSIRSFETYEEAQEFMESHTTSNYSIGGFDPFTSPLPLEELEHYQLVHQSDPDVPTRKKADPIPYVKIFEYLP